jgi:hypothetical protein
MSSNNYHRIGVAVSRMMRENGGREGEQHERHSVSAPLVGHSEQDMTDQRHRDQWAQIPPQHDGGDEESMPSIGNMNNIEARSSCDFLPSGIDRMFTTYSHYLFLDAGSLQDLTLEDACFLEQVECLLVPVPSSLDELVKEYFLHVHPILPIINEGDFWEMYSGTTTSLPAEERKRMSLFVFQAMLFTSCSVS